jgi:ATP-dependent Clp protease ATP-binding subunit ClpB
MDDGRLTDGQGHTVDFRNAILIMTSNVGSQYIIGEQDEERIRQQVESALSQAFKPEFLNRIDDIVIFKRLTKEQLKEIVELQTAKLVERVRARGVEVHLTDRALELLANLGYDPTYGARPLRRVIQKQLVDKLALAMLRGEFGEGDVVTVDAADRDLVFEKGARAAPEAAERVGAPS